MMIDPQTRHDLLQTDDRVVVGTERAGGWVSLEPDGGGLVVGVNPNDLPMNWNLAVITRGQAELLRDWLNRRYPAADPDGAVPHA